MRRRRRLLIERFAGSSDGELVCTCGIEGSALEFESEAGLLVYSTGGWSTWRTAGSFGQLSAG